MASSVCCKYLSSKGDKIKMNLAELKVRVEEAIDSAIEYGDKPEEIEVSIQIEDIDGGASWSTNVELYYDCDGEYSGCVIIGEEE